MQSFFKAEDGLEDMADKTAHRACQKYVGDMIHEAQLQAHVDYYRLWQNLLITMAHMYLLSS
jgi:hypothetical protein